MLTILFTITYILTILLIVTLVVLIIPVPNIVKIKVLDVTHYIVRKKVISLTLLIMTMLLFIDAFIRMRKFNTIKNELAVDTPINTRISTYAEFVF